MLQKILTDAEVSPRKLPTHVRSWLHLIRQGTVQPKHTGTTTYLKYISTLHTYLLNKMTVHSNYLNHKANLLPTSAPRPVTSGTHAQRGVARMPSDADGAYHTSPVLIAHNTVLITLIWQIYCRTAGSFG